jgi:hypothetical protein
VVAAIKDVNAVRRLERDTHASLGDDSVKVAFDRMLHRARARLCTSSRPEEHLPNSMQQGGTADQCADCDPLAPALMSIDAV